MKTILIKLTAMSLMIAIIFVISAGCIKRLPVPVYEKTDEDGTSVYIDGVRYKELPKLKWIIDNVDEVIGYAGSYDTVIYGLKNDPNRDFIVLKYFWADYYGPGLYRTDKVISDVSVENVDKIVWEDYVIEPETYKKLNYYINTIEDKKTITELFDLLKTGEETKNPNPTKKDSRYYSMSIDMYCSQIPAASFSLGIRLDNDRIVCGNTITGYVYMPNELLEKIAGKKINIDEIIEAD